MTPGLYEVSKLTTMQIASSSDHSLHLVLPPPAASQPSNVPLPLTAQRPPHTTIPQPGPVPNAPPGQRAMGHMHLAPPNVGPVPFPQGQFPPHLQQALNNHLQALNQQIATQMASHAGPFAHAQFNATPAQGPQHPQVPQQSFQQVIAQQQHARAAAGQQGVSGNASGHLNPENTATPPHDTSIPAAPSSQPIRASTPTNVNTVVRENQGSNGESWRMVIQSTSTVTAPNLHLPRVPTPVNMGSHGSSGMPPGIFAGPNTQHGSPQTPGQLQVRLLEHELSAIQSALARGTAPAPSVFENARTMLRNVEATEGAIHLRSRLDQLSMQADQRRTNLNNMLMRVVSDQQTLAQPTQHESSGVIQHRSSEQSSVYLLSSPSGPQALLVSPWGTYTAPWQGPTLAGVGLPLTMQQNYHQSTPTAPATNPSEVPSQNPTNNPQAQPQQQQNQQANEARDLLRLLLPLGGHIWLLIRLFGFVYFFTAGGGSRRAFLLGAFAFLVFIAQTGIFRPLHRAVWEPIRRHVEGLLPIPGNELPPGPAQGAVGMQHPPAPIAESEAARRDRQPSPQDAAARLLQDGERRDTSVFREQIRRIERAVALFVGSLVPGFGERHIAARDAAEAIRQAEIRQREDAASREEEERNAQAPGAGSSGETESPPESGDAQDPPVQRQEQPPAAQPPLVEI